MRPRPCPCTWYECGSRAPRPAASGHTWRDSRDCFCVP
nr:MAG TPA: hypothetical protein [Caudoviricetes sp.]